MRFWFIGWLIVFMMYAVYPGESHAQQSDAPGAVTVMDWVKTVPVSGQILSDAEAIRSNHRLHPLIIRALLAEPEKLKAADPASSDQTVKSDPVFELIVYADQPEQLRSLPGRWHASGRSYITLKASVQELREIIKSDDFTRIEPAAIYEIQNERSSAESGVEAIHNGLILDESFTGKNVIVAVFDTGIDWTHPDFLHPEDSMRTRIKLIWDQTLVAQGDDTTPPEPFDFGVMFTRNDIEAALVGGSSIRTEDVNGHGTHVTGTAAGGGLENRGVAPDAGIIAIKGGNQTFTQFNLVNAIHFMAEQRQEAGKPLVGNFSIGGQLSPRDGTDPAEVAMDEASENPGTVMVTSAGNSGNQLRHFTGMAPNNPITFTIPEYTPNTGTMNDRIVLDIWFDTDDEVDVTVTTPSGYSFTRGEGVMQTASDSTQGVITIDNAISSQNGHRRVIFDLADVVEDLTPAPGDWEISFSTDVSLRFHTWSILNRVGTTLVFKDNADNDYSITTPGTSMEAITVGAYVVRNRWINNQLSSVLLGDDTFEDLAAFSSRGPTRDERVKPDISAPGRYVASSRSTTSNYSDLITLPGDKYSFNSGTSMSAPHVAGAVALLLEADPSLSASQIADFIRDNAKTDSFTLETPNMNWGFGKLNLINTLLNLKGEEPLWVPHVLTTQGELFAPGDLVYSLGAGETLQWITDSIPQSLITGFLLHPAAISSTGELQLKFYRWDDKIKGDELGESVFIPMEEFHSMHYKNVDLTGSEIIQPETGQIMVELTNLSESGTFELIMYTPEELPSVRLEHQPSGPQPVTELAYLAFTGDDILTHVREIPEEITLKQNYPNPFNTQTVIRYGIPEAGDVRLEVFDVLGRRVAVLENGFREAGSYEVMWNARAQASGVYLYRLQALNRVRTGKMMLVK